MTEYWNMICWQRLTEQCPSDYERCRQLGSRGEGTFKIETDGT